MRSLLVLTLVVGPVFSQTPSHHLSSLSATERAFAAATRHIGVRNGFLTFFADNAIGFRPGVGPYKPELAKRPQPAQPLPTLLLWTLTEGDVARAGDLGWLTGPAVVRENRPGGKDLYLGQYFSVWRRQSDGTWRVFLDAGIETPVLTGDPESAPFQPHALFDPQPDSTVSGSMDELTAAEHALNEALGRSTIQAATWYAISARFHIDKRFPITGTDSVRAHIRTLPPVPHRSLASHGSTSGDLGYSYGEYLESGTTMYYIRAWKFVKSEGWRVVVQWVG